MGEQLHGIRVTEEKKTGKERVSFFIRVSYEEDASGSITDLKSDVVTDEERRDIPLTPFASIVEAALLVEDHVDMDIIPIPRVSE